MGKMKLETLQVKSFTTSLNGEKERLLGGGTNNVVCQGSAMVNCPTEAYYCSRMCSIIDCQNGGGDSGMLCTIDVACDTEVHRCGTTYGDPTAAC